MGQVTVGFFVRNRRREGGRIMKKSLIVYFSQSSNTRRVAQIL
ncbi:hypothetical protein GCWU000246_01113 [Jonquetella anthropi E3_33 E1]|nr:hypothetical protein GCWU000246_01113 [Jonquetella anthropi E3_33 E1]